MFTPIKNGINFNKFFKSINTPKPIDGRDFFGNIDDEIYYKFNEYKKYIDDHINNVMNTWNIHQDDILEWCSSRINNMSIEYIHCALTTIIKNHDLSKYDPEEFLGYRVKFYPTKLEKKLIDLDNRSFNMVENSFNMAWIKHAHTNKHHPEYWTIIDYDEKREKWDTIKTPMEILYIIEMLLDWDAMGIKFGGTAYSYWENHKNEKPLHSTTITLIEDIIPIFKIRKN